MIKSVTATNHLGESIKIEMGGPEKSGFLILGIEGLGPGKATISTTDVVYGDGAVFNTARVNARNITIGVLFSENPSVEANRHKLYKYFPLKQKIELKIETDTRTTKINGYVESNETHIFSSKSGALISIVCPFPFFRTISPAITAFYGVVPKFEFPFSNESLVAKVIVMGDMENLTEKNLFYEGNIETGMVMHIHANGVAVNPKIINTVTLESMQIDTTKMAAITGSGIIAGDDIIISTSKGEKYIYLERGATVYNILNALDKYPKWLTLRPGDNLLAFLADDGISNLQIRIENQVLHEGV